MFEFYPYRVVTDVSMPDYYALFNVSNATLFAGVNFSIEEAVAELRRANGDRWLNPTAESVLIAAYVVIGVVGIIGNLLLIFIISNTSSLRTARNIYIANLAVSDLTLSIICMPFTLIQLVKRDWPFGTIVCKMVPTFQATNVFVSTFTYSAIAIDRYKVIVYASKSHHKKAGNFFIIVAIWIVALLCAIPMTIYTSVEVADIMGFVLYRKCYARWPSYDLSKTYTISVMVVQYLVPVVIVSVSYTKITVFLRCHHMSMNATAGSSGAVVNPAKLRKARERAQRTTHVLVAIAVVFAVSWLPLNTYNLIADFNYRLLIGETVTYQHAYLAFAVCHALAMSSACWNPLLYGWLNNAMRTEIRLIYLSMCRCCPCAGPAPVTDRVFRSYRFNELSFSPSILLARPATSSGVNDACRTELQAYGNFLTVPSTTRTVVSHHRNSTCAVNGGTACARL